MARGATWTNSDGIVVGFGKHTADNDVPAVTNSAGIIKTVMMQITGTALVDTISATNIVGLANAPLIRRGSKIVNATLMVEEAFTSGGAATLDLGLWGRSTGVVDDADGIDVDIALTAIDAIGDIVICDGAVVNGVIAVGATANDDCVITASYETAVFTAGKAVLVVTYIEPPMTASVAA